MDHSDPEDGQSSSSSQLPAGLQPYLVGQARGARDPLGGASGGSITPGRSATESLGDRSDDQVSLPGIGPPSSRSSRSVDRSNLPSPIPLPPLTTRNVALSTIEPQPYSTTRSAIIQERRTSLEPPYRYPPARPSSWSEGGPGPSSLAHSRILPDPTSRRDEFHGNYGSYPSYSSASYYRDTREDSARRGYTYDSPPYSGPPPHRDSPQYFDEHRLPPAQYTRSRSNSPHFPRHYVRQERNPLTTDEPYRQGRFDFHPDPETYPQYPPDPGPSVFESTPLSDTKRHSKQKSKRKEEVPHEDILERPLKKQKTQVACNFCRRRKLRCDGVKPVCGSCKKMNTHCEYVGEVRRRGPGKAPKGQKGKKKQVEKDEETLTAKQEEDDEASVPPPNLEPAFHLRRPPVPDDPRRLSPPASYHHYHHRHATMDEPLPYRRSAEPVYQTPPRETTRSEYYVHRQDLEPQLSPLTPSTVHDQWAPRPMSLHFPEPNVDDRMVDPSARGLPPFTELVRRRPSSDFPLRTRASFPSISTYRATDDGSETRSSSLRSTARQRERDAFLREEIGMRQPQYERPHHQQQQYQHEEYYTERPYPPQEPSRFSRPHLLNPETPPSSLLPPRHHQRRDSPEGG